jgi:predicted metallopeptidase
MQFKKAEDIQQRIEFLIQELNLAYIKPKQVVCFRSWGSTARARARIWSMPSIWQLALNIEPHYCIEVISEKFDNQSLDDQERILIHELVHIPKGFKGGLVPHRNHKHRTYRHYHDTVETMFKSLSVKSYQ